MPKRRSKSTKPVKFTAHEEALLARPVTMVYPAKGFTQKQRTILDALWGFWCRAVDGDGRGANCPELVLAAAICLESPEEPLPEPGPELQELLEWRLVVQNFLCVEPFPPEPFIRPDGVPVQFIVRYGASGAPLLYALVGGAERLVNLVRRLPGGQAALSATWPQDAKLPHYCLSETGRKVAEVLRKVAEALAKRREPDTVDESIAGLEQHLADDAYMTVRDLAALLKEPEGALRARLYRWRMKNALSADFQQIDSPGQRRSRFLYRPSLVKKVLHDGRKNRGAKRTHSVC